MRTVLSLCVLITVATACPLIGQLISNCVSKSCEKSWPKICPSSWKIQTFDSQSATKAFQGAWYLQMATPIYIDSQCPIKTGLFSNSYPSSNNRVIFRDTTPCDLFDLNTDYYMIDTAFNLATQRIETTQTLFKSAYGPGSPYAIFNVGTESYYPTPILENIPLIDDLLIRHKIEGDYTGEYTVAVIGADKDWNEYMVFAVVNQYDNLYSGNDNHLLWVFTRESNPDWSTYKKAMDDIENSGLNSHYLISIDQSIDLTKVPTVTSEDIEGVITKTSVTSSSSTKSVSTSDGEFTSSTSTSSSTSTTIETSSSTIEFTLRPDYTIPYEFDTYDLTGDIKILKNLQAEDIRDALSGQYYVNQATPFSYDNNEDARVGLLNTAFPASSLQVLFDDSLKTPWDYNTPVMMLDRGYNVITGEVQQTRSVISSTFDGSTPWGAFTVYTEGYHTKSIEEYSPLTIDGSIAKSPGDLYRDNYLTCIAGYQKDKFLLLTVANKFKNQFYQKNPVNQFYVLTRDRILSQDVIDNINQELCRCGYNPRYLTNVDQTKLINDEFKFDQTYFQLGQPALEAPSVTPSISPLVAPRGLDIPSVPVIGLPQICPPTWNVRTFDTQSATKALQGAWYLQLATPTYIDGSIPIKTGLFSNVYPSSNNRVIFKETTPGCDFDFSTDYYMIDSAFNLATQRIETTQTLFKSAYSNGPYAIFNVGTQSYYQTPIHELKPLIDDTLIRHKIEGDYTREYTVAVIGGDKDWSEYIVFAVVNEYDILCSGNDDHIVWVFTRESNPDWSIYKKARDDIKNSGLNPNYLMSIDQSTDLSKISTVTTDDIEGVITETSVTSSSSTKSISTSDGDISSSTLVSKSSSTTTVQTTSSTVEFTLRSDYKIPYEFDTYDLTGDIKILKNLQAEDIRDALSGQYYVNEATPFSYDNSDDARVGLLNTAFPASSLQVLIDDSLKTPWDYNTPVFMLDRGYNVITGEIQQTRSVISSTFDGSTPWGAFTVYTEGYHTKSIEEYSPLTIDGSIAKSPGDLYRDNYVTCIAGYEKDKFLLLTVANKFKNQFYQKNPVNQFYVLTRDRILSQDVIDNINQELCRCGYNPRYLTSIDQTRDITDSFTFENSYFQIESSSSSSSSSVTIDSSSSSLDVGSSSVTSSSSRSFSKTETSLTSGAIDVNVC